MGASSTITSTAPAAVVAATEYDTKDTASERWEKLMKYVTEKAEEEQAKLMNVEVKKSAIKEALHNNLDKFLTSVDW